MINYKKIKKYFKIKIRQSLVWFVGYLDKNYFFRFHILYFVTLSLLGAVIIKLIEIKSHVNFIDCLFLSASALTTTGLVSVDISQWSNAALFIVMIWVQLGSTVLLTLPIVLLRRYFIRNYYNNPKSIDDDHSSNNGDDHSSGPSSLRGNSSAPNLIASFVDPFHTMTESLHLDRPLEFSDEEEGGDKDHHHRGSRDEENPTSDDEGHPHYENNEEEYSYNEHNNTSTGELGVKHHPDEIEIGGILQMELPSNSLLHHLHDDEDDHHHDETPIIDKSKSQPSLTTTTTTTTTSSTNPNQNITPITSPITTNGNNSGSINNSINNNNKNNNSKESSPKIIISKQNNICHSYLDNMEYRSLGKLLLVIPLYIVIIYGIAFFSLAFYIQFDKESQEIMDHNNVNGWWFTLFHIVSSFNNAGLGLFPDSLIQLNHKYFVLLVLSTLIILGNTLFPFFLRVILKVISKFTSDPEPYQNLLENPRSIFTHLFPYRQTIQLFIVWTIFNVSQISLMALFDTNDKAFVDMNAGVTLLNYYFSSISTRTCGFNSVDISLLSESCLLLFLGLMFVSSYPFIISLRSSAVGNKYSNQREVMKDILIRDIFIPYVCILSISIFENQLFESGSASIFQLIFEIVSAFGNVGLTINGPVVVVGGVEVHNAPISTLLKPISKLIVICAMLAGKHRNLPESIDQSINPSTLKKNSIISKIFTRYKRRKL